MSIPLPNGARAFRHLTGACHPGLWLISLSFGGASDYHVHLHCVVDDYGTLTPVAENHLIAGEFR